MIQVLDANTINQIAAGEVIERPSSVVKELVENAIDSGATAITVEIKDGGLSSIRVTDNGSGIVKEEVRLAFLRHATSKIHSAEDLITIDSLGFRGEALASIASVSQVELITKERNSLTGIRLEVHGGEEQAYEEIGCPDGTTILVRNLFYNTPARRKFMKTPMTEGSYITELMQRLCMSRPDISFQYIINGQSKLYTSGNRQLKEIIYHIYGRDISSNLLEVSYSSKDIQIEGYIAKPYICRGNRSYEQYFVNQRFIKSRVITKAIEEAYKTFVMIHKYPFTALQFQLKPEKLDVNVHPTKMEMRYHEEDILYKAVIDAIRSSLLAKELIPTIPVSKERSVQKPSVTKHAEPFEELRRVQEQAKEVPAQVIQTAKPAKSPTIGKSPFVREIPAVACTPFVTTSAARKSKAMVAEPAPYYEATTNQNVQLNFMEEKLLEESSLPKHRLIGQLFKTYWLVEFEHKLFIMDQHAAHEKVMYEHLLQHYHTKSVYSQQVSPPIVITLHPREQAALQANMELFADMGFCIEEFGGNEYAIRSVPTEIFGLTASDVFVEFISSLTEEGTKLQMDVFVAKIASMACKAAVKGGQTLSTAEADALIHELLNLENPYSCPHGRPTIIAMTEDDIERKFKRIQS